MRPKCSYSEILRQYAHFPQYRPRDEFVIFSGPSAFLTELKKFQSSTPEDQLHSKVVLWIELEVKREKRWDFTKKVKISSNLLKLESFADELAWVDRFKTGAVKSFGPPSFVEAVLRGGSDAPANRRTDDQLRAKIRAKGSNAVEEEDYLNEEQRRVVNAFHTVSTEDRQGEAWPLMTVHGKQPVVWVN